MDRLRLTDLHVRSTRSRDASDEMQRHHAFKLTRINCARVSGAVISGGSLARAVHRLRKAPLDFDASIRPDQPALQRHANCLCAIPGAQLPQNGSHVRFHGAFTDENQAGNFLI